MRYIAVCCLIFGVASAHAEKRFRATKLSEVSRLLMIGGDLGFPNSEADKRSDVEYGRKFTNPFAINLGLGFRLFPWLYVGARYEYWVGYQDYTLSGTGHTFDLKYQALGGEVGWFSGNPRVFWLLSITGFYPLQMLVSERSGNSYQKQPSNYTFQGRALLGIRFNSRLFLHLNGGYRLANFGNLTANGTAYIPGGKNFDLSGIFAGMGLGLSF